MILSLVVLYLPLNGIDAVIHLGANSSTTETDLKKILNENFIFSGTLYQLCAKHGD